MPRPATKPKLIELPQALTIAVLNNCNGARVKSLQDVCYHLLSGRFTVFSIYLSRCVVLKLHRNELFDFRQQPNQNLTTHLSKSGAIR
jgi:hypothetical protein